MRARGIDVLAQFGKTVEHPTNSFPDESYSVVTNLLMGERDVRPLNSAIAALGHLDDPRAVPLIAQFLHIRVLKPGSPLHVPSVRFPMTLSAWKRF